MKAKLDSDRPRGQRAVRLGPARPAALDRPRQDVDGAAQAGQEARSREAGRLPRREERLLPGRGRRPVPHRQRRQVVDPAARRRDRHGLRHGVLVEDARATWSSTASATRQARPATCCTRATAAPRGTRSSSCRRRSRAAGSPRRRAAPTTCSAGSRASCSRRRSGEAGKASTLSITTKHKKLSKPAGITVTGTLSPAAGNERVTVSYLPPGSTRWQHADGQDRGQRGVHDELERAPRQQPRSWPSGWATSAPRATARAS